MSVTRTLTAIGRLVRRPPAPPADLLEAYSHEVIPVLDRAEWLYQHWLDQSTLFTDGEKLGNVAAIHRWETATMSRSLERVIPPAALADAHADIIEALEMASRAAQLLSSGCRFHNANAVCEGQALLGEARERRLAAMRSLRRYLRPRRSPLASAPGASAASPATSAASPAESAPAESPAVPRGPAETPQAEAPVAQEPPREPPSSATVPPSSVSAPPIPAADSAEPAAPPASPPAGPAAPTADQVPPTPPEDGRPPPARGGWGSLFGRPDGQNGDRPDAR